MRYLTVAMVLCLLAGVALADDMFPPDWRGQPGTMTAGWGYWGTEGLGPGDVRLGEAELIQANPGGFTSVAPAWAYFNSRVYVHDLMFERQSVLEILDNGVLAFRLENYPDDNLEKKVLVQITFRPGFGAPMSFDVGTYPTDPGLPPWSFSTTVGASVIDTIIHPDGWQTNSYGFTIDYNPNYEGLSINFTEYEAFVDQVVIDTWCVPEPATLSLLALGGLALIRRRRK